MMHKAQRQETYLNWLKVGGISYFMLCYVVLICFYKFLYLEIWKVRLEADKAISCNLI